MAYVGKIVAVASSPAGQRVNRASGWALAGLVAGLVWVIGAFGADIAEFVGSVGF